MFHQVHVLEEDADLLRFLWWPGGDISQSIQEYRMGVHLFGATSPSCANYALQKCAEDNKAQFSQHGIDNILYGSYVADCLLSTESEVEAISLSSHLSEEERPNEVKDLDRACDHLPVEQALGMWWCPQSDAFKFFISIQNRPLTRRGIISIVSFFYDPLGFLASVIFTGKRLL